MEKKLRVAGSVIGELSDKIPNNVIALNELIKNSYDAGAKEVSIVLDTKTQKLAITDNGDGMDDSDIDILLQISKSIKKYGAINPKTKRYTQGSKGLGFLSVFKFGDIVTWTTIKDKKRWFTINYQDILSLDDVSDYLVTDSEEEVDNLVTGTTIDILLKNNFNPNDLKEYLLNEMNRDKILNSFIDEGFIIKLDIDGEHFKTKEKISLMSYYTENQLFHVSFTSDTNEFIFTFKNHDKYGKTTNPKRNIPYNESIDNRFKLTLKLMIFDFSGGRRKNDNIDQLFIIHQSKLTPLIYINKNLFNNFTLFDPELLRHSKSSISLPQMIGFVEIISDDKDIQFNSDRTQFQENELTKIIIRTLEDINKFIQKTGSDIKSQIKKENERKDIPTTPPQVQGGEDTPHPNNDANDLNDGDKDDKDGKAQPPTPELKPVILDVKTNVTLITPTGQVDLRKYIQHAVDSRGQAISLSKIEIQVDGVVTITGILESISDICKKTITYSYNDTDTGNAIKILKLDIIATPLKGQGNRPVLIPNKGSTSYKVNFKANPIIDLISQLEELYSDTKTSYSEVIACSLRALFELSIYELEMAELVKFDKAKGYKSDLLKGKVVNLISSIKSNDKLIGTILKGLGRSDFQQFKNELGATDFGNVIEKCHLGAHKSTNSLSEADISYVGNVAGLFLAIVSELLNNTDITWTTLGQPWGIEIK